MKNLVNSKQQIINNITSFMRVLDTDPDNLILDQAGKFKCWYCYFNVDRNCWLFGPSKYVGYADIDVEYYNNSYPELDGKLTEKQLKKFSSPPPESLEQTLHDELFHVLSRVFKIPSKNTKIKVVEMESTVQLPEKRNYQKSEDCFFYSQDDKKGACVVTDSVVNENNIKFDWLWDDNLYTINLSKVGQDNYWKGIATLPKSDDAIKLGAFVRYTNNSIEIVGDVWFEEGVNYLWSVSLLESE